MKLHHGVGAGLLGALCAVALGCGSSSSSLLESSQAAGLKDTLGEVRSAVDGRNCGRASARLRQLRSEVGDLGGGVDRELRQRLREEINDKLAPAVTKECDDSLQETIETTTTPAPTGPTGPVETEPAPEETTETEETPPPGTTEEIPTPDLPETETGTVPTPTVPDPTDDPGGISPDDLQP